MEGIKYGNLIEIGLVIIEIRGVENGELVVPVNNTLVHHIAFLATDTQQCVLILACVQLLLLTHFVSLTQPSCFAFLKSCDLIYHVN